MLEHLPREFRLEEMLSHHPDAVSALQALVGNTEVLHPQLFDWFAKVLGAFDPNCALAYAEYVRASLDRATAGPPRRGE
jgi:hypothetical protein